MNKNRLKLLDIDPLEVARQLTIMESNLYKKIKAIECLQRSREQKVGEHRDHITDVIQMTNKVCLYPGLSRSSLKHFIHDRLRTG